MSRLIARCTFDRLLTTLVFLTIAVACALTPMQGDSWWQLRAGRDMWASRSVMLTDIYSHTWPGAFWLNHEWLAEVVYYAAYAVAGLPGVTLLAATLILGGWSLAWRLTEGSTRQAFFLVLLAVPASSTWWEPRPHAFSLLFIPLLVTLIARERLAWLPPVFAIWANCHGGVLLGFVLLIASLAAYTMTRPEAWKRAALTVAACALAMTATPLGLAFWTEIPRSLGRIRLYSYDEWQRPELWNLVMAPFWILAALFAGAAIRHRGEMLRRVPARAPVYAGALLLLPLALMAKRNVGPFLLLAVPAMTFLLPRREPAPDLAAPRQLFANLAIMAAGTAIVTGTIVWAYSRAIPRLKWTPVPAPALAALDSCPGNLYNRFDEGGELLWFAPSRQVFVDGRQDPFPTAFVLEHIGMERHGDDYKPVFARHEIRCAYLPPFSPTALALANDGWTTLYRDDRVVVLRTN